MVNEKDIKMAAHSIYFKNADKPKETVIARGKVEVWKDECDCRTIDRVQVGDIDIALEVGDYDGKTIEIIIREVTNQD